MSLLSTEKEELMKKILTMVLSVMLAVVFASGVSFAAEKSKEKAAETKAAEMKMKEGKACEPEAVSKVSGTVKSIDPKKGELVLTGEDGKDTTFVIKKTQGKKIKAGDKVDVTCVKKGEQCMAKRITKARGGAKKEAPMKPGC